ncbi:MAG: DNA primase [Oscillospiraceae bacterium]|jgi:signal recognition particle subunit SEC65
MTVKCMYYRKEFKNKPNGYEIAEIQNKLDKTQIEIKELAEGLSHGATFKPALLNGRKSSDWISQQLFALDFDHDTTIQEQLNRCHELNIYPCFGYTSFSHTEQEHHFRLVFCSDKVITDIETRNKLQNILISLFDKSDNVTKDCTRIFFGGRHLICNDFDKRINAKQIIDKYSYIIAPTINKNIKPKSCKKKLNYNSNKAISIKSNNTMALHIEAIKTLNVGAMRALLKGDTNKRVYSLSVSQSSLSTDYTDTNIELHSQQEVYDFINNIDLSEYLGVEYGEKFNCILPEHKDANPSACIWTTKDGTQVYKCFGCGKCRTIIGITEELAGCKRSEAIEFIKSVYGITLYESDWTKKWKQILIDCANYLDTNEFKNEFPELSFLIRTRKIHIQKMLLHYTQYVSEDMKVNDMPIFFGSYKKLMDICGIHNKNQLSQSLTLFALLNMIDKLPAESIPEKELHKAKHIAAKYGFKKLTGFYSFKEYGVNSFKDSEEIAKILKKNHMSLKGLSREYILRTFGKELADKVYPQYQLENSKGTSQKSDNATAEIMNNICNIINEKGYCLESEIRGKGQTQLQWKRSIQYILDKGNFNRVKASKANKKKYNIPDTVSYQSYVIVNK